MRIFVCEFDGCDQKVESESTIIFEDFMGHKHRFCCPLCMMKHLTKLVAEAGVQIRAIRAQNKKVATV